MRAIHAVITAAGSSSRMGGVDKLLLPLDGIPLLVRSVSPFLDYAGAGHVVVAVNPERVVEFQTLFEDHLPRREVYVTAGGSHRQQSILFALRRLFEEKVSEGDPVMIHDGARPFVTTDLFDRLLDGLEKYEGVIPALPVRDTVKRVEGSRVVRTEDRETLRMVQTPQLFRSGRIRELHERAAQDGFMGTDDASLLEHYGWEVGWVEGPAFNLKITVPEDVALLQHLFGETIKS